MRNASGRRQLAKVRKPRAKSATTKPRQVRRKPVMHPTELSSHSIVLHRTLMIKHPPSSDY